VGESKEEGLYVGAGDLIAWLALAQPATRVQQSSCTSLFQPPSVATQAAANKRDRAAPAHAGGSWSPIAALTEQDLLVVSAITVGWMLGKDRAARLHYPDSSRQTKDAKILRLVSRK
jgi:hypothetical protein